MKAASLFQKSVDTYLQIIQRTPEDPRPYVELGRTYYEIREDDAAQLVKTGMETLIRTLRLVTKQGDIRPLK